LELHTLSGLSQLLHRLKIAWKRARWHVHSPDPDYLEKLRTIWIELRAVHEADLPQVLLFEDEFTLYRHPSLAQAFEQNGKAQPLAELGYKSNYTWRIAAALNAWTGQVTYHQARVLDVTRMILFWKKLHLAYPTSQIQLVLDNWPIHYHPDVVAALQPQTFPFGSHASSHWSTQPARPIPTTLFPIRLLFLPTYASWTNPIEKLWRLLRQEVLHLHRYQDDWPALKQRVFAFLDEFALGSKELLRYVGLEDPLRLYHALFPTR
jgi:transposase